MRDKQRRPARWGQEGEVGPAARQQSPRITHGETPLLLSALLTPACLGRSYSVGMRNYYFKKEKRTVNFIYVFIQKLTPIQSLACKK